MQLLTLLALALACLALALPAAAAGGEKKKGDMSNYLKRIGAKFLEEVAQKPGIVKLKSGMLVEVLKETDKADAKSPNEGDSCKVTYFGTLKDGSRFDSGTTSFAPNQVIKGWTEALQLMGEGDKWKIYIPYDLGYGAHGAGGKIGPYAPLVFELEIHQVNGGGKPLSEARAAFKAAIASPAAADL